MFFFVCVLGGGGVGDEWKTMYDVFIGKTIISKKVCWKVRNDRVCKTILEHKKKNDVVLKTEYS